jgi:hypothetical protein
VVVAEKNVSVQSIFCRSQILISLDVVGVVVVAEKNVSVQSIYCRSQILISLEVVGVVVVAGIYSKV